ncbi:MAG: ATP-grasp domain-containing protein [Betaproteobacteria bacterium]|nr:ATP-grasp domain-containing protein [Betaproteobacteria bacterium]
MPATRLALFSAKDCPQLALIRDILVEKGADPLICDMRLGGDGAPLVSLDGARASWNGHDFSEVAAIYIRCTAPNTLPSPPAVQNAASYCEYRGDYLREQGFSAATVSFFAALGAAGKLVINQLDTYADHDTKAQLYEKLRAQQFPVPETLTTNDPERAWQFMKSHAEVVVKPSVGVGSTRLFNEQDRDRLDQFRICPVMIQERIRGDTLRINIVGDSVVLAIRIVGSNENVDSRTAPRGFDFVKLPDEEEARIVRANRALGLHYAAWDIIESHDGRYLYLDCNPGPYILWTGAEFSRAVLEQLGEYMIGYAETGSVEQASARVRPYAEPRGGRAT